MNCTIFLVQETAMDIYLLSGYAGSGKSHVSKLLEGLYANVRRTSFAKRVKDDVARIYSIPRDICDTQEGKKLFVMTATGDKQVRELLIEYATKMKQTTDNPAIWADYVVTEILANPEVTTWILDDWRFKKEYERLRSAIPSARIHRFRIYNSSVKPLEDPSEHDLDDEPMDFEILNTGTSEELISVLQMYNS